MLRNLCDVHTHTIGTRHAYSTIEENVRAAAQAGLELLGSADHFSDMTCGVDFDYRDFQYFLGTKGWPETWHGVRLLSGIEADIVDLDGHLFGWDKPVVESIVGHPFPADQVVSLEEKIISLQAYAIASVHGEDFAHGATPQQVTDMYVKALENPRVLMLGHIGRSNLDYELDPILCAARDMGKLIEINEHSLERTRTVERCRHIATRCAELGVQIAVNTDAHISASVGRFDRVLAMLEQIDFPQQLIATRDAASFMDAMHAALGDAAVDDEF